MTINIEEIQAIVFDEIMVDVTGKYARYMTIKTAKETIEIGLFSRDKYQLEPHKDINYLKGSK